MAWRIIGVWRADLGEIGVDQRYRPRQISALAERRFERKRVGDLYQCTAACDGNSLQTIGHVLLAAALFWPWPLSLRQ